MTKLYTIIMIPVKSKLELHSHNLTVLHNFNCNTVEVI